MNGKKKKKTKISFTLNNANLMALKSHTRIVITRKQWNRKTTLQEYSSVFEVVTKQIALLFTY